MEQEGQIKRALCYACFTGAATPVDAEIMTKFANAVSPASVRIEKSFVDRKNKKSPKNRPEWNALLEECHIEGIDYVVIPSMTMLSYHLSDAVDVAREIRLKYGINIHFLYEDIFTGNKTTDQELYIDYFSVLDYEEKRKDRQDSLERGVCPFWEFRKPSVENPKGAIAYIGFLKKSNMCSTDKIMQYLNRVMCQTGFVVGAAYADLGKKGRFSKKEGWANALTACASPDVGVLIVSSAEVIGDSVMDIVAFIKHIKEKYGVETYFLLEDIYTGDSNYEERITNHCGAVASVERLSKRKEKMKEVFRDIEIDYA